MSTAMDTSPAQTQRLGCQSIIDLLVADQPQILGALVSTVDGFEIAARLGNDISPAKLAAMTSSLLALGEAVSVEGGVDSCVNVVIEARAGRLLLMDIPGDTKNLLTVVCDNGATLGTVLWAARECSQQLGRCLAG